eukprot:4788455-Pyramimonas_sp.AAC.1
MLQLTAPPAAAPPMRDMTQIERGIWVGRALVRIIPFTCLQTPKLMRWEAPWRRRDSTNSSKGPRRNRPQRG